MLILCILFFMLLLLYMWYIEPRRLRKKQLYMNADGIRNLVIVQFSDTHIKRTSIAQIKQLIQAINAQHPDFIVFTGDLFDCYQQTADMKQDIIDLLKQLQANIQKFAVFGNHDIGGHALHIYRDLMEEAGFIVLCNQVYISPKHHIAILGIDDACAGYEDLSIANMRYQKFQILLSHAPDIIDHLHLSHTDLMLSGHTHGGQVYFPLISSYFLPKKGKKYRKGCYQKGSITLFVSAGVGTTRLPFRLFNPPEYTLIHVIETPKIKTKKSPEPY